MRTLRKLRLYHFPGLSSLDDGTIGWDDGTVGTSRPLHVSGFRPGRSRLWCRGHRRYTRRASVSLWSDAASAGQRALHPWQSRKPRCHRPRISHHTLRVVGQWRLRKHRSRGCVADRARFRTSRRNSEISRHRSECALPRAWGARSTSRRARAVLHVSFG